jgi:plasmid stabilization system protein ParE
MKVEYSARAVADLHKISADSLSYGDAVAAALEARIRQVIARIAEKPLAAQRIAERPGVHVVPLIRYPFKIFYRVLDDRVRILHIRHVARRPWTKDR